MSRPEHNTAPTNQSISWSFSRSDFNGKEKDWESSFHYYGARYYWSEVLTGWLSVDPMADKYPNISPYAYCAWNPVKLVDPEGEEALECDDKWQFNTSTGRLTWKSDEGGNSNQTVEIVHNQGGKTIVDQTVSFNGGITRMFDCSVVSSTLDCLISGGFDIATGVSEVGGGLALGTGISAVSGGAATSLGLVAGGAIVAGGSTQIMLGIKEVMATIEGHPDMPARQDFIRESCSAGLGFGASLIKTGAKGLRGSLGSFAASIGWSYLKWKNATYPKYKGIPKGAMVK